MTVSDNTIAAECLGDFIRSLGSGKGVQVSEKMDENVLNNPRKNLRLRQTRLKNLWVLSLM